VRGTDRTATSGEVDPSVLPDPDVRRRFEELALSHLEHLYRLAIRLKGSAQDAEDLVQETCVKALRAFPALSRPGRSAPGSARF
jgi:DNA-directed RNA polymerase specialized sigma24 family protein